MSQDFSAHRATADLARRAAHLAPDNPFQTPEYLRAQETLGEEAWIFQWRENSVPERACFGYIRSGRISRTLRIPSLLSLPGDSPFWDALRQFCAERRVTDVELATMGSPGATIPAWPGEAERIARTEFAFDLRPEDLLSGMSKGHRERIKKARKHGVTVRRGVSRELIDAHVALHVNSMKRREQRGEDVPLEFDGRTSEAFLASGAGELYQAMLGETVVSSLLILRSRTGAYSESSGNSAEGMSIGASHFLRYETALALRNEGVEVFYLGGVRPHEGGLRAYKEGFGTHPLPMESISAFAGSRWQRKAISAVRSLRENPREFLRTLIGRSERYVVFAVDPHEVTIPTAPSGWVLAKLDTTALTALPSDTPELRAQHARIHQGRINDAWGLYIGGVLAGVCWLIPSEHDRQYAVRNVKLRPDEAEITHCVTLPEFRGRGVYPYMIRVLCGIAADRGIRRLFMITNRMNVASQRGITKAGLCQIGGIYRHVFPYLSESAAITFRRHRWGALGWP